MARCLVFRQGALDAEMLVVERYGRPSEYAEDSFESQLMGGIGIGG